MIKLKKSLCVGLAAALITAIIPFAACAKPDNPKPKPNPSDFVWEDPTEGAPVYDGSPVQVSSIASNGYGNHIKVEENDFLYVGAQIRVDAFMNCDKLDYPQIRSLIGEAAKLGVTCVEIPVEWAKMEIEKDVYDYTFLCNMMTYANEFDVKIEFLWYGTNMCGDTHSYTVPDYILRDGKTYPKFDALRTGEFWNFYGIMWYLDFDNENLIAREANAVSKMMEYVYRFDSTHGGKKPVIGVQILNEPDIFIRYRVKKYNVISRATGQTLTEEEGWTKICASVNALGKAVKNSNYKVYTRVNFAGSTAADSWNAAGNGIYDGAAVKEAPYFAKRIQALEGIDIVGDDSYSSRVKNIKGIASMYAKIPGNVGHIAENDGRYSNTASLILAAVSQHCGYMIYDLLTPPYYVANDAADIDQGIIKFAGDSWDSYEYRGHYAQTKALLSGLRLVSSQIYNLSNEDFICFNTAGDYPENEIKQSISSTNVTLEFTTATGAVGFALDMGDHIDVYLTGDGSIKLTGGTVSSVKTGVYENGEFVEKSNAEVGGALNLSANTLYRIDYTSNGKIKSTTWDNIGG